MNRELQPYNQIPNAFNGLIEQTLPSFSLEVPRVTVGVTFSAMCWTAVRDGAATMTASMTTLAVAIGLRGAFSSVPGLHHLFAVLTGAVGILAGGTFGANLGNAIGGRTGRWVGGFLTAGTCLGLTVLAIYNRDDKDRPSATAGLFGTVFYSCLRELMQGVVGKRIFPRLTLDSAKALRWEKNGDTARHGVRLGVNFVIYAFTCTLLNGMAAKNVVSANFGAPGQPTRVFSEESLMAYGFRSLNEASDAFFGVLMMALIFTENTRPTPDWGSCKGDDFPQWWKEVSSRVFMNLCIADIGWLLPKDAPKWLGAGLTAFTEFRGAMANMKPGEERHGGSLTLREPSQPWVRAGGRTTRGGGDCLLNAADGVLQGGEWTCLDPNALRARLRDRLLALVDEDPRLAGLVEYHLQQAVAHLNARAGVEGYQGVVDGDHLIAGLPEYVQMEFDECLTADDRMAYAARLLASPQQVRALLHSVANYYGRPGCYLPANLVPFLAQELNRPLALHVGSDVAMYDHNGVTVYHPIDGMRHIRHIVAGAGEAADHFERVQQLVLESRAEEAEFPPREDHIRHDLLLENDTDSKSSLSVASVYEVALGSQESDGSEEELSEHSGVRHHGLGDVIMNIRKPGNGSVQSPPKSRR